MKNIYRDQTFDQERALYGKKDIYLINGHGKRRMKSITRIRAIRLL